MLTATEFLPPLVMLALVVLVFLALCSLVMARDAASRILKAEP